jgi:hypothetical protein
VTSLVSVILPTRNRAESLPRAAASVLDQNIAALELVIVDDASTDSTVDVLDRLSARDPRVRVVHNDTALGPCEARNRGLVVAEGDLVAFCDDDDAWVPGVGADLVSFLEDHRDFGGVSCWHVVTHGPGTRRALFRGPLHYGAQHLLWQNFVALPFAMLRREALSFDIRFDPALPTGEDWDLWLRCAQQRPFCTLPRAGYLYAQHGGDRVTRTASAQVEGRRNFVAKHLSEMTEPCRMFHEAVIAGAIGGRQAVGRYLASHGVRRPGDVSRVSALLAMSYATSHLGPRRGDPGLQSRLMAATLSSRFAPGT